MTETEIRALLGVDEEADIGEAIRGLQTTIVAQKAVIETDTGKLDAAEAAKLRNDLAEARRKNIIDETENARRISAIEETARRDRVDARVEKAIGREGKPPRMRDQLLELGMTMATDKFDEFIATIPSIDMTERGVATGSELAELEPSAAELAMGKSLGNDRMAIMRQKARDMGLTLPAEVA